MRFPLWSGSDREIITISTGITTTRPGGLRAEHKIPLLWCNTKAFNSLASENGNWNEEGNKSEEKKENISPFQLKVFRHHSDHDHSR